MSFNIEDSIFIAAGYRKIGPVAYENYLGQILPADVSKIIWYDSTFGGDDSTGDGSYATPYLTPLKCLEDVTIDKFYVLDRSFGGRFVSDPADRVYWNPATGSDTNDGLSSVQAVQTYGAAKAAAIGASRAAIHAEGSFTMTDMVDFPVQGEIGETIVYNVSPTLIANVTNTFSQTGLALHDAAYNPETNTVIAIADISTTLEIHRSTDGAQTWSSITNPWSLAGEGRGIAYGNGVWIICGSGASVARILRSTDDGLTWTNISVSGKFYDVIWTGQYFVICGKDNTGVAANYIKTSTDGITWTDRTDAFGAPATTQLIKMAVDTISGKVMIVGYDGTTGKMQFSNDHGLTWTDCSGVLTGSGRVKQVGYGAGVWLIRRDAGSTRFHTSTNPENTWTAGPSGLQEMDVGDPFGASIGFSETLQAFLFCSIIAGPSLYSVTPSGVTYIAGISSDQKGSVAIPFGNAGAEYALLGGLGSGSLIKIDTIPLYSTNVRANFINFVCAVTKDIRASFGALISNLKSIPTSGSALFLYSITGLFSSYIKSLNEDAAVVYSDKSEIQESYFRAISGKFAMSHKGKAVIVNDISIERNIVIGSTKFHSIYGSQKERIRDNIFLGTLAAESVINVFGGDIVGARSNVNAASDVQGINPMISDLDTGKLDRESTGQNADSYLCSTSNYFLTADGAKADPGPHAALYSKEQESYDNPYYLPKPLTENAMSHGKKVTSGDLQGLLGEIDVYNNPELQQETLIIRYRSLFSEDIAFFRYLESLVNTKVLVNTNPEKWKQQNSIQLNGAAAIGDIVLNIDPTLVYHGQFFSWAGVQYYCRIVLDQENSATRIVLNSPLKAAIPDNTVILLSLLEGQGQYNVQVRDSEMKRAIAHDPSMKRDYTLQLTRKWIQ